MDHRFLVTVLETAGFKPEFHTRISMLYHNAPTVVQVNGMRSEGLAIGLLLCVLALEPLLPSLRDEKANPALRGGYHCLCVPPIGHTDYEEGGWEVRTRCPSERVPQCFRACLAYMPDCPRYGSGLEETALHAFFNCEQVARFTVTSGEWTARAARFWLRRGQCRTSVSRRKMCGVSRVFSSG